MHVAVCVKQIPDTAVPFVLDPADHTLVREGKLTMDDSDAYGVEMGLQLVEAAGGGEVTLVSMTAKVLAAVMHWLEPDLVLAGTESTDGYTGTMPVQLAELLCWPSVSFAKHVEISDGVLRVRRQTEAGYDEVTCPLPAVVTVTAGVVEPRYPSFKGIMAAKSKPIEELTLSDLGLDPSSVGFSGARQKVISVEAAEARKAGEIVVDEGDAHERVISFLEQLKIL